MQSTTGTRKQNNRLARLETRLDAALQQSDTEAVTIDEFVRELHSFRTDLGPKLHSSVQVILIADYMNRHAETLIEELESHDRTVLSRFPEIEDEWHRLLKMLLDAVVTQYLASMKHRATSIESNEAELPAAAPCLYVARRETTDELAVAVSTQTPHTGVVTATACLTEFPFTSVQTTQQSESNAVEVAMQQLAEVAKAMAVTALEPVHL